MTALSRWDGEERLAGAAWPCSNVSRAAIESDGASELAISAGRHRRRTQPPGANGTQ